jgi:phage terminase small subunit
MLAHRQNAYLLEIAKDQNGSCAARAAGYSATSAHEASSRLLRNDKVRAC